MADETPIDIQTQPIHPIQPLPPLRTNQPQPNPNKWSFNYKINPLSGSGQDIAKKITVPIITRIIEIVFAIIIIAVYYGSDTEFKYLQESVDGFGQFVIIVGFICACSILIMTLIPKLNQIMPYVVLSYNIIWILLYYAMGVVILTNWDIKIIVENGTRQDEDDLKEFKEKKEGGICVGCFCLFQVVVLIINSIFSIKANYPIIFSKNMQQ